MHDFVPQEANQTRARGSVPRSRSHVRQTLPTGAVHLCRELQAVVVYGMPRKFRPGSEDDKRARSSKMSYLRVVPGLMIAILLFVLVGTVSPTLAVVLFTLFAAANVGIWFTALSMTEM